MKTISNNQIDFVIKGSKNVQIRNLLTDNTTSFIYHSIRVFLQLIYNLCWINSYFTNQEERASIPTPCAYVKLYSRIWSTVFPLSFCNTREHARYSVPQLVYVDGYKISNIQLSLNHCKIQLLRWKIYWRLLIHLFTYSQLIFFLPNKINQFNLGTFR